MSRIVRVRGVKEDQNLVNNLKNTSITLTPKGRVALQVSRDASEVIDLPDIDAEDVACVEFANGFKYWTQVGDLHQELPVSASRGVSDLDPDVWELDMQGIVRGNARGAVNTTVKALEIFGVDLEAMAAEKLCDIVEVKQLQNQTSGMHQLVSGTDTLQLSKLEQDIPASAKPILLFIHGTASSTQGSFGKLWTEAGKFGSDARIKMWSEYGDACYAFEHRSLTVSPIDNALEIIKALPANAELHLVTHSRGGLIGELLCLGQRDKLPDYLQQKEFIEQYFTAANLKGLNISEQDKLKQHFETQKKDFSRLIQELDRKKISISRFVRVACPARGTSLASGRLDRWLSVLSYLSGGNDLVELLLGIVKKRTDPRSLPGIAAMMPNAPLIKLLNNPLLQTQADLTVIAGDIDDKSLWGKLKLQLSDWFFADDHDLVVNTGSMSGGLHRAEQYARFFFDQGPKVNHFNYFANQETVTLLKACFAADSKIPPAGFKSLIEANHTIPALRGATSRVARINGPQAIVLHGIMGSHLAHNSSKIWLDYFQLSRGKLAELAIQIPGIETEGLIEEFYAEFIDYLSPSHVVTAFAYDWRLSLQDSAARLANEVHNRLLACEATRQPLRLVAHSMGGLVVRLMFAVRPDLWQRFRSLPGSRFLMLGTPNRGSYEAIRWLTGWNPTLGKLSWLDVSHDTAGLVNIVKRFPGLLELLPQQHSLYDFTQLGDWQQFCQPEKNQWPLPSKEDLLAISATWKLLNQAPIDTERMLYVAGCAEQTVCGFNSAPERGWFTDDQPSLRFMATAEGDGTVPWSLGKLDGVKTWYVETPHEYLLTYRAAFQGYLDLLQSGSTTRLKSEPPTHRTRDAADKILPMRDVMPDSIPAPSDLSSFTFGAARPTNSSRRRDFTKIEVSIRHGNLAYARYPICLGHYLGQTFSGAEAHLDSKFNKALSKRLNLGLYPGELNTHAVFLHNDMHAKPNGALVIGLGRVGELSVGSLKMGVAQVLLDYALKVIDCPDKRFSVADKLRSAPISFVLIGTSMGALTVRDAIEAILEGVKSANERLTESGFNDQVKLDAIEFVELYQDLAIQAARELNRILQDNIDLYNYFVWPSPEVKKGEGGLKRILSYDQSDSWHRLEIVYDRKNEYLRFIPLTEQRARIEVQLVAGQMQLADDFISSIIASTHNAEDTAKTLFEMLIPNGLKEIAPNQYDVVLIVDEVSAHYPWEMLQDRWGSTQKPLSVVAGMLRQLKTEEYRSKPLYALEKNALVVGNPYIPVGPMGEVFPSLPGAAREAEAVAAALQSHYNVTTKIGADAESILISLHAAKYRILHLAGHGVFDFEYTKYFPAPPINENCCAAQSTNSNSCVSGMVIGDHTFLTPYDIEQMRWVPELVFINCCHLGNTAAHYAESKQFGHIAANLGTHFIRMGVKAVIAAGWAVDDAAAKVFAEKFYACMLNGESFGLAVRNARKEVYRQFPQINTWGAYQCYGDAGFCLKNDNEDAPKSKPDYHLPSEWLADLDNILSRVESEADNEHDWIEQLSACCKRVPPLLLDVWQKQADILATIGMVYGELGNFKEAIAYLAQAIQATQGSLPIKAIEKRANYQSKYALKLQRSSKNNEAVASANAAIKELETLNNIAKTPERLALLGSAYERLAVMQNTPAAKKQSLLKMSENNKAAFEGWYQAKHEKFDSYSAYAMIGWMTAEVVLSLCSKAVHHSDILQNQWPALSQKAMTECKQSLATDPEYWLSLVEPDCLVVDALVHGALDEGQINHIAELYKTAVGRGTSIKRKEAIRDHVHFLIHMLEQSKHQTLTTALQNLLKNLP